MSISTRRGDTGSTQLAFGPRVSKADPRVAAYGTVDELGAVLGLARSFAGDDPLAARLERLQRELFTVGAVLATPPDRRAKLSCDLTAEQLATLDAEGAEIEALPGLLADWALPGATRAGAFLDLARTVARRAEREVVGLVDAGAEPHELLVPYLNRLSDVLWLYSRWYEIRVGADGALRHGRGSWTSPAEAAKGDEG